MAYFQSVRKYLTKVIISYNRIIFNFFEYLYGNFFEMHFTWRTKTIKWLLFRK